MVGHSSFGIPGYSRAACPAGAAVDVVVVSDDGESTGRCSRAAAGIVADESAELVEVVVERCVADMLRDGAVGVVITVGHTDKDGVAHRGAILGVSGCPGGIITRVGGSIGGPPRLEDVAAAGQAGEHGARSCAVHDDLVHASTGDAVLTASGLAGNVIVGGSMELGLHELRLAGQLAAGHEAHLAPASEAGVMRVVDQLDGDVEVACHRGVVELEVIATGPDVATGGAGVDYRVAAVACVETHGGVVGGPVGAGGCRYPGAVADYREPGRGSVGKGAVSGDCRSGGISRYGSGCALRDVNSDSCTRIILRVHDRTSTGQESEDRQQYSKSLTHNCVTSNW